MICDLCGKMISADEAVIIPLSEMQQAARDGFNPYIHIKYPTGASLADLSRALGVDPDQMFQAWRQRVMTDTTDWGLCPACAEVFRRVTGRSPAKRIEKRRWQFWK